MSDPLQPNELIRPLKVLTREEIMARYPMTVAGGTYGESDTMRVAGDAAKRTDAARTLRGLAPAAPADVSPDWAGSTRRDRRVLEGLVERQATPAAITYFADHCRDLGDYWYWFTLGTLWVNYSGWSDLGLWRRLFSASRPNRRTSLMKPSEIALWQQLPDRVRACRAHRRDEKDWLSLTLDRQIAARFARERGVDQVMEYAVDKRDVLALFTRRGEAELLVLNRHLAQRLGPIDVIAWPDPAPAKEGG